MFFLALVTERQAPALNIGYLEDSVQPPPSNILETSGDK
jgi:hypothetical protein